MRFKLCMGRKEDCNEVLDSLFVSSDSENHKHEPTLLKEDAISPAFPEACQVAAMIVGLDAYISGKSQSASTPSHFISRR